MSGIGFNRMPSAALMIGLAAHAFVPGCQASGANGQMSPEQRGRFEALQAKGTQASLTVFPVVMGDSAHKDVGNVVALLLEQAGMTNLETSETSFRMPQESTFDQTGALFGEYVRENEVSTEYALYAEILGTPDTGPKEIRGVIVNRAGQTVWVDRQSSTDRAFSVKPGCPMSCCVFLTERVRTQLGIPKSARDDSGEGKLARKFAKDSPAPDKAEWEAMEKRQAVMKKAGRSATVAVFPVRFSDEEVGVENVTHLANLLRNKTLCDAKAVDSTLRVKIQPSRNEQKALWALARTFQEHVMRNPPETDYVLLADYMMHPRGDRAVAVHFVVCDRRGDWVIVDFQNDHHGDFQSIDPKTHEDCGRLVAKRLAAYLR